MKIYLCSDVHIEFGPLEVHNRDGAEVLILSGDIVTAIDLQEYSERDSYGKAKHFMTFFKQCSTNFKHVLYVMGNHEHYHGDFATSADILRTALKEYSNIHFMDKESITIEDVTFIGGTLWTDMNKEDYSTIYTISRSMNDFRIVKNTNRMLSRRVPIYKHDIENNIIMENNNFVVDRYEHKEYPATFSPEDAIHDHKKMIEYIDKATLDATKKYVIVGHHAPSKISTKPQYENDTLMNGGYSSDLSEFILDRPQIKLWTHGHTHDPFDYMIGATRIVCNPRGYINYEEIADNFEFKLLEV